MENCTPAAKVVRGPLAPFSMPPDCLITSSATTSSPSSPTIWGVAGGGVAERKSSQWRVAGMVSRPLSALGSGCRRAALTCKEAEWQGRSQPHHT